MPDYKVTFVGDLGNLRQFDAAVRNSAVESARQIENAHKRIAGTVGKVSGPLQKESGAGLYTNKQKTQVDAVNRSFEHSGELIRRTIKDYEAFKDSVSGTYQVRPVFSDEYVGQYKQVIGNLDAYEKAMRKVAKTEQAIIASRRAAAFTAAGFQSEIQALQASKGTTTKQLNEAIRESSEQGLLTEARRQLAQIESGDAFLQKGNIVSREDIERQKNTIANKRFNRSLTMEYSDEQIGRDNAQIAELDKILKTPQGTQLQSHISLLRQKIAELEQAVAGVGEPFKQDLAQIDAQITAIEAKAAKAARKSLREQSGLRRSDPGYADVDAAKKAIPPIQRDLATVLNQSKELRKNLLTSGLGGGAKFGSDEFVANLAKQEAAVGRFTENIRTNTRTIQGSFRDLKTGLLKDFTVDLDQNGKVVGRWGGQLRGAGTFLKQTVRDFQKVIEWTVATTLVFGALATVVTQLQGINELNTSLARFSITAQTTAEETNSLFQSISAVAYNTATPLKDLVKVADDIALATREANQSTQEWHQGILDLTQAVGIFTNLTGKDTVQSADLLSAAFKQLDIAPDQLISVLNKVTAVAGGQATAIADILQSVGGLAEAAKAAGFDVDEMVGSVQVLAQVTNKTSDEIATSFKNLFGSISSVGSVKILKEFGIEVRDSTGGVKDFLDIYGEIKVALEKGIIPENRLPDVLRGISGGPRRAPDAAALLANYDRIQEVVQKSQGATNEALIANAKILDTNQAKLVQFQNAFDTAVFERFGKAVEDLTGILTTFATQFLQAFNGIDAGLISAVATMALFAGGARLLGGVVKTILPSLTSMKLGLKGISSAFLEALENRKYFISTTQNAKGLTQFRVGKGSQPVPKPGGGFYKPGQLIPEQVARNSGLGYQQRGIAAFQRLSGAGKVGVAAGFGALGAGAAYGAAGLKSGEINPRDIGFMLQAAGGVATLIPGLQAIGVAGLLAGTALQFMGGETEKVKKSAAELNVEVYDLTKSLQSSQQEANGYANQQKTLGKEIDALNAKQGLTADEQSRLISLSADYATATLGLATANATVSATFDELLIKIPELSDKYNALVQQIRTGGLSPDSAGVKALSEKLAADILRASGQIIYSGAPIPLSSEYRPPQGGVTQAVTTAEFRRQGNAAETFDLSKLVDMPAEILRLFNLETGQANFQIPANDQSLSYLQSALQQLPALIEDGTVTATNEQLEVLGTALTKLAGEVSSATANIAAATQLRATAQSNASLGIFNTEELSNANFAATLIEAITAAQGQIKPPGGFSPDIQDYPSAAASALQEKAAKLQQQGLEGLGPTNSELTEIVKLILQANGALGELESKGYYAFAQGIYKYAQDAGASVEQLDALAIQLGIDLAKIPDTLDEINTRMETARANAGQAYADRSLQLLIAENSGQYEDNAKGLAILQEQNKQAYESTLQLAESINNLNSTSYEAFAEQLSKVTGLQYLQTLSGEELQEAQATLGNTLIENAVKAGVNAEGIQKITEEVARLIGVVTSIPPYKRIIIEVQEVYTRRGYGQGGFSLSASHENQLYEAIKAEAEAKAKGTDPASQINDILKQINKIMKSGSGSNLGSSSSPASKAAAAAAKPYNKPGLLDIPEEILEQTNYRELLQKAITNAKNLQGIIPGESKQNKDDIVELLNGTKRILETKGIGEEYLRRALDELTDQIKRQNDLLAKADTIRRFRVNQGSFSSIANVPLNAASGVSLGGPQGPINISLNMNGTVLTPAQFAQFANLIGAAIKRQLTA